MRPAQTKDLFCRADCGRAVKCPTPGAPSKRRGEHRTWSRLTKPRPRTKQGTGGRRSDGLSARGTYLPRSHPGPCRGLCIRYGRCEPERGCANFTVEVADLTTTTATISWSLDQPATGQVEYGKTAAYGSLSTPELTFNYSAHVQALTGLAPGTLYHFRVRSTNQAGVQTVSGDNTFSTPAAPSPTPTPAPTPTPGPTPTPAPDPPGIPVPGSIDASGGSDVGDALQRFVDGVPDGSTIVFKSGGTYRVSHGLRLFGRHGLVFAGNGATIQTTGPGDNIASSPFWVEVRSTSPSAISAWSATTLTRARRTPITAASSPRWAWRPSGPPMSRSPTSA